MRFANLGLANIPLYPLRDCPCSSLQRLVDNNPNRGKVPKAGSGLALIGSRSKSNVALGLSGSRALGLSGSCYKWCKWIVGLFGIIDSFEIIISHHYTDQRRENGDPWGDIGGY